VAKMSKAEKAGWSFGISIVKMSQLIYRDKAKKDYLRGIFDVLKEALR